MHTVTQKVKQSHDTLIHPIPITLTATPPFRYPNLVSKYVREGSSYVMIMFNNDYINNVIIQFSLISVPLFSVNVSHFRK